MASQGKSTKKEWIVSSITETARSTALQWSTLPIVSQLFVSFICHLQRKSRLWLRSNRHRASNGEEVVSRPAVVPLTHTRRTYLRRSGGLVAPSQRDIPHSVKVKINPTGSCSERSSRINNTDGPRGYVIMVACLRMHHYTYWLVRFKARAISSFILLQSSVVIFINNLLPFWSQQRMESGRWVMWKLGIFEDEPQIINRWPTFTCQLMPVFV